MAKKKTYRTNVIKESLNYCVKDIAERFCVHKRTVQTWLKEGLPAIKDKKPYLVLGYELKEFIKNRQQKRKVPCKVDELYCCKCKAPRKSLNNTVDIKILNEKKLLIKGVCPVCNIKTNKILSIKSISEIQTTFTVQTIHNKNLLGSYPPILNTDIKKELSP